VTRPLDEGDPGSSRDLPPGTPPSTPPALVVRAWSVHAFTGLGAVFGLLALLAIARGEWRIAFLWMAATVAIDAVDGGLARWAVVGRVLPGFDGALLDNLVDYLNYAVVPAFFLALGPFLPAPYATLGGAAILLASAYQFGRVDAKTEDHFFTGFPSYWNIVVFYLLFLDAGPLLTGVTIGVLTVLAFVPFRYVYPSRTPAFRSLTISLTCAWGAACLAALALYPTRHALPTWTSLLYVPYYILISVAAARQVRGR
jgi:phosphatidylcholine synthase